MNKRIKLGSAIEGRDEKGIKKTVAAFLKILHPGNAPTDSEFEEYVAYAIESRRRVKEQMNKRKSDDEFALINLSYFDSDGEEIIVDCPESRGASATQEPNRRDIHGGDVEERPDNKNSDQTIAVETASVVTEVVQTEVESPTQLEEQHFEIHYGASGYTYESIVGPYLVDASEVVVEDPYIRVTHQVTNFVRFCEAVIKQHSIRSIRLITSYDADTNVQELATRLDELKQSLLEVDIKLEVSVDENLHDREIRINNGWTVKIGRGLDFYQKPDSWFGIGSNDYSLRKCLQTKIDVYRH